MHAGAPPFYQRLVSVCFGDPVDGDEQDKIHDGIEQAYRRREAVLGTQRPCLIHIGRYHFRRVQIQGVLHQKVFSKPTVMIEPSRRMSTMMIVGRIEGMSM